MKSPYLIQPLPLSSIDVSFRYRVSIGIHVVLFYVSCRHKIVRTHVSALHHSSRIRYSTPNGPRISSVGGGSFPVDATNHTGGHPESLGAVGELPDYGPASVPSERSACFAPMDDAKCSPPEFCPCVPGQRTDRAVRILWDVCSCFIVVTSATTQNRSE